MMADEQEKLKQQLAEKNEEIVRLCEQRGAEDVLQSGEFHSAHSTPYTSMESDREASSHPATGPRSREGGRFQLLQELDGCKSQIGRYKEENAKLKVTIDTKHKRIVDLEGRLDQATQLQPMVEHLTMELSKYQQGGEDSGELHSYKARVEEAEEKYKVCEKEYQFERRENAKLQQQISSLRSEITELKSGSGQITNIDDDSEVVDTTLESTKHKTGLEREGEEGKESKGVKERDGKREGEWRRVAMVREQNKEWKRSLSENDQEMEKKMRERDREWEQRLQEKQHEWGERVERREVELQGKKKEIRDLKNKVKELEKAAALLGKVQQHSKGQSQQLMQLQDEAKVKGVYSETLLKQTPLGLGLLSIIARCP